MKTSSGVHFGWSESSKIILRRLQTKIGIKVEAELVKIKEDLISNASPNNI